MAKESDVNCSIMKTQCLMWRSLYTALGKRLLMVAVAAFTVSAMGDTWALIKDNAYKEYAYQDMQYWRSVEGGTNGVAGAVPSVTEGFIVTNWCQLRVGNVNEVTFGGKYLQLGDASSPGKFCIDRSCNFPNDGLIVYNQSRLMANYGCEDVAFLGGSKIQIMSESSLPAIIDGMQTQYSNITLYVTAPFVGGENAGLNFGGLNKSFTNITIVVSDISNYRGSIIVAKNSRENTGEDWGIRVFFGATSAPASITVGKGGGIGALADDAVIAAQNVQLKEGSRLWVTNSGCVKAINSLSVETGTKICVSDIIVSSSESIAILQGPADSAFTVDDFVLERFAASPNRNLALKVETDEASDTKTLYLIMQPLEMQIETAAYEELMVREYNGVLLPSSLTNASAWSDGKLPHSGVDYYSCKYLHTPKQSENDEYEFGGDRLVIDGCNAGIYAPGLTMFVKTVKIPNLSLRNGGMLRRGQHSGDVRVCVTGGVEIVGKAWLAAYQNKTLTIDGEIFGSGEICCQGVTSTSAPCGHYALNGLNTNFFGTVCVSQIVDMVTLPYLYLYDGRNLGGKLPSFNPYALRLDDCAEVIVTNKNATVTLEDGLNRGIAICCEGGFDSSTEGTTLQIDWPILLDGCMNVRGSGRVVLGGTMTFAAEDGSVSDSPRANSNLVCVADGATVVAANSRCLDGCDVSFGQESKIVLRVVPEDEDLSRYGIRFTKEGTAITLDSSFSGTLPLSLETSAVPPAKTAHIGIVTVPSGSELGSTVRGMLPTSFPRLWKGLAQKLVTIEDEESGTVTVAMKVFEPGFAITFR